MTTLMERPTAPVQQPFVNQIETDPLQVIVSALGRYSVLEVAQAYYLLGERPIPLCDPEHAFVSANHVNGYRRKDGTIVATCASQGNAPLEWDYSSGICQGISTSGNGQRNCNSPQVHEVPGGPERREGR
jgi:hypothetical protein